MKKIYYNIGIYNQFGQREQRPLRILLMGFLKYLFAFSIFILLRLMKCSYKQDHTHFGRAKKKVLNSINKSPSIFRFFPFLLLFFTFFLIVFLVLVVGGGVDSQTPPPLIAYGHAPRSRVECLFFFSHIPNVNYRVHRTFSTFQKTY